MYTRQRFLVLLFWVIIFVFIAPYSVLGQKCKPLQIKDAPTYNVVPHVSVYRDSLRNININNISKIESKFCFTSKNSLHLKSDANIFWLRFEISNATSENNSFYLEIGNPLIDSIEVFGYEDNIEIFHHLSNHEFPKDKRKINHRLFVYNLTIEKGHRQAFFVRLKLNAGISQIPISLHSQNYFIENNSIDYLYMGVFYGILTILFITAIFLLIINVKRLSYIGFALYIFCAGLLCASLDGVGFQLIWSDYPFFANHSIFFLAIFAQIFLAIFTVAYFELKVILNRGYKIIYGFDIFLFILGVLSLTSLIYSYYFVILTLVALTISMLILLISTLFVHSKNPHVSNYFIVSFLFILGGGTIIGLSISLGLFSIYIGNIALKIGVALQIITMTIALIAKIKILQNKAYNEALESLQKLNKLKENANMSLEQKVKERTYLLTKNKKKLESAYQEITEQKEELEKVLKKSSRQHVNRLKDLEQIKLQKEELQRANKQIKKNAKLRENFLANTSHELRTPLNAIIGFVNLLLKTTLTHKQFDYMRKIKISGDNLLVVVNDILDFSKLESGKLKIETIEFDFKSFIKNLITTIDIKAEEKDIRLIFFIDPMAPMYVQGDPYRLNQILNNLIGNAIKFTERNGTVKLIINLLDEYNDSVILEFNVIDTGIGISQKKINTIFDDFIQAETFTSRKYGGTGLGLSIVKNLVEMQGGQINVKSEVNKGSSFIFTIKYKKGLGNSIENTSDLLNMSNAIQLADIRILLVEDNEINQTLAIDTLKGYNKNIKIDVALNGLAAIKKLKENDYDIVLMDIQMPKMDGLEATQFIREKLDYPKNKIPILGLSAHAMTEEKEECLKAGMDGYMTKPFDAEVLIGTINTLIGNTDKKQKDDFQQTITLAEISDTEPSTEKIDLSLLNKMYKGNQKKIRHIVALGLKTIPKQLEEALSVCKQKEWDRIRAIMHTLKTTYGYLGAHELTNIAKTMEADIKANKSTDEIPHLLKLITSKWEKYSIELELFLNEK